LNNQFGNPTCGVSRWEMNVGVAHHFSNQPLWPSANKKEIDLLVVRLIPP